ncbi:MAG: ATP-binding protein [Nanoarchaeota archaeon]
MIELVTKQNPWWEKENWPEEDHHIQKYNQMKYRWVPSWIEDISLSPFSLNFILGCRQIGKTTGIKLLINDLLKKAADRSILYLNCDLIADSANLKKVLENYLTLRQKEKIKTSYVFLDEVSSVEGWWKTVKGFMDLGLFNNDVITVLGSLSIRLKKEAELFPGRRGKGKNINVYPLAFGEFLKIHNLGRYSPEINQIFEKYKKTGGFPLSINEDSRAEEYFIASFESDIAKLGKSVKMAKEIITSIMRKVPSAMSFHAIASDIGLSHKTVQDYLELFENMFLLKQVYFHDGVKINFRKEKKIVFLDPFIAKSFANWGMEDFLESALYEWIVQSELIRRYGEVYYYKNNYEIDCFFKNLKIEVKAGKPHRTYPKGVTVLGKEEIPGFLLEK